MCKNISRPFILGIDFLRQNLIDICWTPSGKFGLKNHEVIFIESLETCLSGFSIYTKNQITIPGQHISVLDVKVNPIEENLRKMYNIQPNIILQNEYPTLITIPTGHRVETLKPMQVPYVLINLAKESVSLEKGELLGNLEFVEEDIEKTVTNTAMEIMSVEIEEDQNTEVGEVEKKIITSPTDVEVHQKVNLQDAKITN